MGFVYFMLYWARSFFQHISGGSWNAGLMETRTNLHWYYFWSVHTQSEKFCTWHFFIAAIYLSMLLNKVFSKAISGCGRVVGPTKNETNLYWHYYMTFCRITTFVKEVFHNCLFFAVFSKVNWVWLWRYPDKMQIKRQNANLAKCKHDLTYCKYNKMQIRRNTNETKCKPDKMQIRQNASET